MRGVGNPVRGCRFHSWSGCLLVSRIDTVSIVSVDYKDNVMCGIGGCPKKTYSIGVGR